MELPDFWVNRLDLVDKLCDTTVRLIEDFDIDSIESLDLRIKFQAAGIDRLGHAILTGVKDSDIIWSKLEDHQRLRDLVRQLLERYGEISLYAILYH